MKDVINLNKARKAVARRVDQGRAAENRAAFGRTKAQRSAETTARDAAKRALDGARREP